MNVGQVRTHMISVKTVAVMDMKIVPGHGF
jgi:hypothetical protein